MAMVSSGEASEVSSLESEGQGSGSSQQGPAAPARSEEAKRPPPQSSSSSAWPIIGLAVLALVSLAVPLALSGLWDPHELRFSDFARRVAVTLLGATDLVLEGSSNDIPTVEELGRGELPVLWVAFGFKVFGLSPWAGRFPMMLSALAALGFQYWSLRRLLNQRVALLATLVLLTVPAFFTQARSTLGDSLTMACCGASFALLALALFDRRYTLPSRWALLVGAALAMFLASLCRGVLIGVAVPALSVGLTWLLFSPNKDRALGAAALLAGVAGAGYGLWALASTADGEYLRAVGTTINVGKKLWTHDQVVHFLGHAFFPWSVLLPAAFGMAFTSARGEGAEAQRASAIKLALVLCSVVALGAYSYLGQRTGVQPFGAVFALAALVAVAIDDWDRRAFGAPKVAMMAAAFLVLLLADFRHFPEKGLSAFGVGATKFPESFEVLAERFLLVPAAWCIVAFGGLALEGADWARALWVRWIPFARFWRRRWVVGVSLGAFGMVLSLGYYPALAGQISPISAFETYRSLAGEGEPLATVGKEGSAAAYHGAAAAKHFHSARTAVDWLVQSSEQRRWLAIKSSRLARVNSWFRRDMGSNIPVLDSVSSEVVLVSNRLQAGEQSSNALAKWLPESRPNPVHQSEVVFGDKLRLLGWEIRDESGNVTEKPRTGEALKFLMFFEVLGKLTQQWKVFVHIDGQGTRFNGDHDMLEGDYAMKLWNKGDFVTDTYSFSLEPSFSAGEYTVFFGLFSSKSKRFEVTEGTHKDDRVAGGTIDVVAR